MKIKFIHNQKLMNSIFLSLIPLIIPSNNLIDALILCLSLITVHILSNIAIILVSKYVNITTYKIPIKLSVCVVISFILGLIFSLIFKEYSSLAVNTACYVAISEMLLNTLLEVDFNSFKENLKYCLPHLAIISIILIVTAFVRELIGSGKIFGFALPLGNLKPIGFFSHVSGGLLLLGIIVVLYSLLIKNNEEENI